MEKAEFDIEIARLAGLEYIDYCRESKDAAKRLGITKRELDRCVKDTQPRVNDERFVYSEGSFYHWTGRIWAELSDVDIQKRFVSRYDGAHYGISGVVRLDQHKAKSIIKFIAQEMDGLL
jgi:hypothetical protein